MVKYNDFREVCAAMQRWAAPLKAIRDAVPGEREVTVEVIVRKAKLHVKELLAE